MEIYVKKIKKIKDLFQLTKENRTIKDRPVKV